MRETGRVEAGEGGPPQRGAAPRARRRPRGLTALFGAAVLVAAAPVLAEPSEYSRESPYLGLFGVAAIEDARSGLAVDDSGGLQALLGFRVVPELAVELMGEWLSFDGRNPWSLATQVRLYPLPFFDYTLFDDRLQPFVLGTAGIQTGELGKENKPGGNFRGGIGADWWLDEDWALTTVVQYSGSGGEASFMRSINVLLGVTWRFDDEP